MDREYIIRVWIKNGFRVRRHSAWTIIKAMNFQWKQTLSTVLPVANLDDPPTTMWILHSLSVSVNEAYVLNVDYVSVSVTKS